MQLEEENARPAPRSKGKTKKARHKAKRSRAAAREPERVSEKGCDEPTNGTPSEAAASCSEAADGGMSNATTATKEAPTAVPVAERPPAAVPPKDDEMLMGLLSDLGVSSPDLTASSDLAATSPASVIASWMCCPITKVRPQVHLPQSHSGIGSMLLQLTAMYMGKSGPGGADGLLSFV